MTSSRPSYFKAIDSLIATARSNKVATCPGIQDFSQLEKDYGREQAEVIMNIVGNIISGQVVGGTAKPVYQRQRYFHQPVNTIGISYPAIKDRRAFVGTGCGCSSR